MGSKTAKMMSLDGDVITIEFKGANVTDGTIEVCDITTQMDGSSDYEPVKYTTASVTCIVDGLKLLDLYATTPLAVSVKVVNETTGKLLFSGYVSPNTFNQPLDGYNDELTIECVDCLGIAKFVPYAQKEPSYGFSTVTVGEALLHIASLINVAGVQVADTVRIVSGDEQYVTNRYDLLTISEQYFFKSIVPRTLPSGAAELYPMANTCYDALKMIAESFRMSWVQEGETIYLHDYVAARSQGAFPTLQLGTEVVQSPVGGEITLLAENFAASGSSISITPRSSLYSFESVPADSVPLLQELFSEEMLTADGEQIRYEDDKYSDNYTVTLAQELMSAVYAVGTNGAMIGYVELKHPGVPSFSEYWSATAWGDKEHRWSTVVRLAMPEDNVGENRVFSRRIAYSTAVQGRNFLGLRLKINAAFSNDTSRLYPFNLRKDGTCKLYITLSIGGPENPLYYNEITGSWSDEWHLIELLFPGANSEWRDTFYADIPGGVQFAPFPPTEVLAWNLPNGRVDLSLWIPAAEAGAGWKAAYIKELALDLVPRPDVRAVNILNSVPKITYKGTYGYNDEADTVKIPIELEHILAERYFGTKIEGIEYMTSSHVEVPWINSGRWNAKLRFVEAVEGEELHDMLERVYRLATQGDETEIEITIRDTHNDKITPFVTLLSSAWTGRKLPVAISKNYRDNYAKIKLL